MNDDEKIVYDRSLSIVQNMIAFQEELVTKYKEALANYELVKERGFITEDDIKQIKNYIPLLMRLQYKQYLDRYDYRNDFDLIYENSRKKGIKQFDQFSDPRTLKQMTTKEAEKEIKEGLSRLNYGEDLRSMTDEEYDQVVLNKFDFDLDHLLERVKSKLRNPKL